MRRQYGQAHRAPAMERQEAPGAGAERGSQMRKQVTHCARGGHEFTAENTYIAPSRPNVRVCRICKKERDDQWRRNHPNYQRSPGIVAWHRANGYRYRVRNRASQTMSRELARLNEALIGRKLPEFDHLLGRRKKTRAVNIITAIAPIEPLGIWL